MSDQDIARSVSGVIWITGLSGSGKTSLAKKLRSFYLQKGINPIHLDGDELREALNIGNLYDIDSRLSLGMMYARLSQSLASQGHLVIVSTIALFDAIHSFNREFGHYCEIFLDSELSLLKSIDSKAVYKNATKVHNSIVGIDIQPQFPKSPHRIIRDSPVSHDKVNIEELFLFTLGYMNTKNVKLI